MLSLFSKTNSILIMPRFVAQSEKRSAQAFKIIKSLTGEQKYELLPLLHQYHADFSGVEFQVVIFLKLRQIQIKLL